jgi:hypothetical protein
MLHPIGQRIANDANMIAGVQFEFFGSLGGHDGQTEGTHEDWEKISFHCDVDSFRIPAHFDGVPEMKIQREHKDSDGQRPTFYLWTVAP